MNDEHDEGGGRCLKFSTFGNSNFGLRLSRTSRMSRDTVPGADELFRCTGAEASPFKGHQLSRANCISRPLCVCAAALLGPCCNERLVVQQKSIRDQLLGDRQDIVRHPIQDKAGRKIYE